MSGSEETGAIGRLVRQPGLSGVALRILILTLILLLLYPVIAALAAVRIGPPAWGAAALAAGVCWLGSSLSLLISAWLRGPHTALQTVLLGMLFRMGLPLTVVVLVARTSTALTGAGFVVLILGFYFVTLVVETLLSLTLVSHNTPAAKAR